MNHNDIRHMLSEYIDGAITAEDRAAIEEHLATCEKCREALKELRQTVAHIRSVEELDPPSWMKQKIMTKVRAEAEKKSWFQRFFFPLHIKLPLEAVGVLFIAVTAVFIYQNMQSAMRTPNPLLEEYAPATKPLPDGIAKNEKNRSTGPSRRSNEIPQSPEYKALDMKQEYEKPAQPTLRNQEAAPAPMVPAKEKQTYPADGESALPLLKKEEAGSGMILGRAVTSPDASHEAAGKARSVAPVSVALSGDKAIPSIILRVMDLEATAINVEKAIARVNGTIVRREAPGSKMIFFVTIKARRTGELRKKLKLLGELTELPDEGVFQQEQVELRIELVRKPAPH
jgi:hypothetical protein